jgi:hypothetical protein
VVAHAYNLSNSEDRDQEDHSLSPDWLKKKFVRYYFTNKKAGCGDVYLSSQKGGKWKYEDHNPGWPGHKSKTLSQK